jgi:anti-sigma factor RsiW
MSAHLSPGVLNSLADDELSAEQLAAAQQHLNTCPACTSRALAQTLLKQGIAKSGRRYAPPHDLAERLKRFAALEAQQTDASSPRAGSKPESQSTRGIAFTGWAVAAVLLLVSLFLAQRGIQNSGAASAESAALVTEVCDLHVSALAATAPPQVVSTDRHTVKPWFQGKIPFSFNLPQDLPDDTKLEGANLTYLRNQPVAQLLYSIGPHRVSVFVRQKSGAAAPRQLRVEHSGFHISGFITDDLEVVAVSDVDPARLSDLVGIIEQAQTNVHR